MTTISLARHLFPPAIIRHTVWLYLRFSLSYRDVEDLLAERGLDVSYESVRRWVLKFGPLFARELRCKRHRSTSQWHLDEMAAQRVEELGALAKTPGAHAHYFALIGSRALDDCSAWIAVSAMVYTMSSTSAPRDRSFTGLRSPCSIGPTLTTWAERCTAL
jgi:hypothetical protein